MSEHKTGSDADDETPRSTTQGDSKQAPDSSHDAGPNETVTGNAADTSASGKTNADANKQEEHASSQTADTDASKRNVNKDTESPGETRSGHKRDESKTETDSPDSDDSGQKPPRDKRSSSASGRGRSSGSSGGDSKVTSVNGGNGSSKSRRRPVIALIALLVALVALGIGIWLAVSGWQRLQGVQAHVDTLAQKISAATKHQDKRLQRIKQLDGRLQQQSKKLTAMRDQLAAIKKRNQQLTNAIAGSDRSWQLRRIRSLLLAASRVLQLQKDPQAALAALKLADRRAAALNDPTLFNLRKQLAAAMRKLRALPSIDRVGIALKLATASRHIRELPLADGLSERFVKSGGSHAASSNSSVTASKTESNTGNGASWLEELQSASERALHSVGNAFGNLVIVRRSDTPPPQLLPPDRAAYLAQNLVLDLKNAEAAILRGHPKLYNKSLASAIKLLKQYFDTGNPGVSGLINELQELKSISVIMDLPDISGSLKIINKLIAGQGAAIAELEVESARRPDQGRAGGGGVTNTGKAAPDN